MGRDPETMPTERQQRRSRFGSLSTLPDILGVGVGLIGLDLRVIRSTRLWARTDA